MVNSLVFFLHCSMEHQRPHLLIISISMLYWFRITADCWKFDGGGPGALGPGTVRLPRSALPPSGAASSSASSSSSSSSSSSGLSASALAAARGPPPVIPGSSLAALLNAQQQDMLYACPLNSMCQCAGLPNETSTLIEINCNEVALYKFPGM